MTRHESFIEAFNFLAEEAHINAQDNGFHDEARALQNLADAHGLGEACRKQRGAQLNALIASEIGEALEGLRGDIPSRKCPGFTNEEEEYADAIIRILDMNRARGMRIGEAVIAKMEYNPTRGLLHGGKKF